MRTLNDLYTRLDRVIMKEMPGLYKVETIGDCYMASSGLLVENEDHARQLVQFAQCMLESAQAVRNPATGEPVQIRVGIHSGRVMVSGSCSAQPVAKLPCLLPTHVLPMLIVLTPSGPC